MTNAFQRFLIDPKNKGIIWQIIKLYHPDLEETYQTRKGETKQTLDKIQVYLKYDWVCIRGNDVSIGIEYKHNFSGPGIKLSDFQNVLDRKLGRIVAWRFYDDSFYKASDLINKKFVPADNNPDVHDLLLSLGTPLPTAKEMYKYYYED